MFSKLYGKAHHADPNRPQYKIRARHDMLTDIKDENNEFDIIVVGGGSTGTGAALDAATRGLKVLCVEREDFSSGTSSRSTKLIWGGSRYLAQAFISLLNFDLRLLKSPYETISTFWSEYNMVLNCHRERLFLLQKQSHLVSWIPIAVPFDRWFVWPPPFNYPPASLSALGLMPLFFKYYDAMSGFRCPPSHIMTVSRARRKFPQLANNDIKYCSVFYEGIHDDARTNLAIALTAAREGATMLNYCEVLDFIRERPYSKDDTTPNHVRGVIVKDKINNKIYKIKTKSVLFCGGPFTDELRRIEDPICDKVITGASGIHIVIPDYFAPNGFGMLDMNTSDGRFLFYLPWEGHVIIGTTDRKCEPTMRPIPPEDEIEWLLKEASKYLSPELKLSRNDVLSVWSGIRPLVKADPIKMNSGSFETAKASRDHMISYNSKSGTVFISGGKWTTYREMAEDAINKIIECKSLDSQLDKPIGDCCTLDIPLVGYDGYSTNLAIQLTQKYRIPHAVSSHLVKSYAGNAEKVITIAMETEKNDHFPQKLLPNFPYIEAEILYAIRNEWAVHAEDIIARRLRIAFLNTESTKKIIPKVVKIMANELHWNEQRQQEEIQQCVDFLQHFGGPKPISK